MSPYCTSEHEWLESENQLCSIRAHQRWAENLLSALTHVHNLLNIMIYGKSNGGGVT